MGNLAPGDDKAAVRRRMLSGRANMSAVDRATADAALLAALVPVVPGGPDCVIAAYEPFAREPGGALLLPALRDRGQVLLPHVLPDRDLDWVRPDGERVGINAIGTVDLIVVPAVAVDRGGVRLGRGGGSYDRALARVPAGTRVIALLYDGELVETLPSEPHDRPVTDVITPGTGVIDLSDAPPYVRGDAE